MSRARVQITNIIHCSDLCLLLALAVTDLLSCTHTRHNDHIAITGQDFCTLIRQTRGRNDGRLNEKRGGNEAPIDRFSLT